MPIFGAEIPCGSRAGFDIVGIRCGSSANKEEDRSMRKIIIDTDPGIDDAAAIAIAMFSPELDVQLITTVSGNVSVEKTTHNALRLMTLWNAGVPVAAGASRSLTGMQYDAGDTHGEAGMDGFAFDEVTVQPLTNLALLFVQYPEVKEKIEEIVLMGGAFLRGNITPAAEFNIYVDPEAADIVFRSGLPIVMCGLELANMARITGPMVDAVRGNNPTAEMIYRLFEHYRDGDMESALNIFDSTAVAYLLAPELYTTVDCFVGVETASPLTRGMTVCDLDNRLGRTPNVKVCTAVDPAGFQKLFIDALASANGVPENPTAAMWLYDEV